MERPILRIASANMQNNLADPATRTGIAHALFDVIGCAEALPATATRDEQEELRKFYDEVGYDTYLVLSDDSDNRGDQHYLALLVKKAIAHRTTQIRLRTRNAIALTIGDILIIMVHLDDRLEAVRVEQVDTLMSYIAERDSKSTKRLLVMGDFNATHPSAFGDMLGKAAQTWTRLGLPSWMPGESNRTRLGRIGGLLTRLGGMATSRALVPLNDFEQIRFEDADRRHRPTMPRHFPIVQLDHMFVRNLVISAFLPGKSRELGPSDHRPLAIEVYIDE